MTFTQREAQGETLWLSSPVSGIDVIQLWMRGQEAARIVSGRAARTRPCLQRLRAEIQGSPRMLGQEQRNRVRIARS